MPEGSNILNNESGETQTEIIIFFQYAYVLLSALQIKKYKIFTVIFAIHKIRLQHTFFNTSKLAL